MTYSLFTFTLRGHPLQWCVTLRNQSIHSLNHFIVEMDCAFHHFDHKALNKKNLELWKAPHESMLQFGNAFVISHFNS